MLDLEQKELVEKFHYLLAEIINGMSLPFDEWYDFAAIALCEGVRQGKETVIEIKDNIISAIKSEQYRLECLGDIYDIADKINIRMY